MSIPPRTAKSVVLMALSLIERAIKNSQEYSIKKFKISPKDLTFDLQDLIDDVANYKSKRPILQLLPFNWKGLVYTAMIVSIKYIYDVKRYWNIDFVNKIHLFDLINTNKFENLLLEILDFKVFVSSEDMISSLYYLMAYKKLVLS
jgi:hypothetical protein